MNIAAAIKKFVNSKNPSQAGFMPLDKLFEEKTGIRIQTVNITMRQSNKTYYTPISEVNKSKSIAFITSYINGIRTVRSDGEVRGISDVIVWLNSDTEIASEYIYSTGSSISIDLTITVTVIEFGASVEKG